MKKTLFGLVLSILLFAVPTFAQKHGNGGGGQRGGNHDNRGHVQSQPQPQHDNRGRGVQHENPRAEQQFHQSNPREGYHYSNEPRGEFQHHWDGRRFDHDFFETHWGRNHPFYWSHVGWYGPRYRIGSYFWFNGIYFSIVEPIPPYWYDDAITVIWDEDCGCYYAVNDRYPGVRIHIGIRF